MLGKIDDELRGNVIFFTKVKLIADAGADQSNSFSFVLTISRRVEASADRHPSQFSDHR